MINIILIILILFITSCNAPVDFKNPVKEQTPVIANDISNQKITAFAEDEHGHIWIGTFRGLNKYDGNEFYQFFSTDDSLDLADNNITDLILDSKKRLWIATVNGVSRYTEQDNFKRIPIRNSNQNGHQLIETRDGRILLNFSYMLGVYNPENESFDRFEPFDFNKIPLFVFIDASNDMWTICERTIYRYNSFTFDIKDSVNIDFSVITSYLWGNNELWIAGDDNIAVFDTRTCRYISTPQCIANHDLLMQSTVKKIYSLNSNSLLFVSENNGSFVYNRGDQTLYHQDESGFPFVGTENSISTIFVDTQQNIWLGTEDQGFLVHSSYKNRFNNDNFLNEYFRGKPILSVSEDDKRNMWLLTSKGELYIYNLENKKIENLNVSQLLYKSIPQNNIKEVLVSTLFIDNEGNLWLGSKENGKVWKCILTEDKLRLVSDYDVFGPNVFTQDNNGTIWLSTTSEYVYSLKKGDSDFEPLQIYTPFFNFVSGFITLRNGKIMASPFYHRPKMIDPDRRIVEEIIFDEAQWENSIPRSVLITNVLFEDSRGEVWIGTKTNGLLRFLPEDGYLEPISGAPCMDIVSIEEDLHGNLWVGTEYGLGKYDRDLKLFTNYYASSGIGGNQFIERASYLLSNGTLVFGGTHGLTFFNPIDVPEKQTLPLLFENLKVHNQIIRPQDKGSSIDKHLSYKPDIRLRYFENGFSISFAALDYSEYDRVKYYYMLEGFDNYWVDANNNREAYYANLPSGKYKFSVRITDNDQSIVETQESINIIVEPKPWLTWWAKCIYLILISGLVYLILRGLWHIRKERELAYLAEMQKQQEQKTNEMNMRFFTNISHEFRTPLTMISGPISQLAESKDVPHNEKELIEIIKRSVVRMLQLINQLMDFNKLENDTLNLRVKKEDVTELLKRIIDIFCINAKNKGIEFKIQGLEDRFEMWIDEDKLDKIVSNLLSNAIKFTPQGGIISVEIDIISEHDASRIFNLEPDKRSSKYFKLTITDSGKGIPEGEEEKIFNRFYKAGDSDVDNYYGTGIGLYHALSLAKLHHGYLKANNKKGNSGAVFTLLLPINDDLYSSSERIVSEDLETENYQLNAKNEFNYDEPDYSKNLKSIVVVEDDSELANFIRVVLSPFYNVICFYDAVNALEYMLEDTPDLVISDIVMPEKDGYSLCKDIKDNLQLSHIPVILLTAKSTLQDKVKGLDTGADAYITKPFEPPYLLALIKSQLSNREKVQMILSATTKAEKIDNDILSPQDNIFMKELYDLMESEISNSELDIIKLTDMMKISRSKFYYKVKGLTGETPAVFFRSYKLNRAAELLKEGKYNISEVADLTGFTSLSHFSTSFKKQFGISPSDYK